MGRICTAKMTRAGIAIKNGDIYLILVMVLMKPIGHMGYSVNNISMHNRYQEIWD